MEQNEAETMLKGQAQICQLMFGFADSMALKCVVQLRVADTINAHGGSITLSHLASCINSSSTDITCLSRIMRLLVRKNIFTAHQSDDREVVYGLTNSSKWLLYDSELSLAPMIIMQNHESMMLPWHYFSECVREGGISFKKSHGVEIWDFASQNPDFNQMFNESMKCTNKILLKAIVAEYKDGFRCIESLVDVGGGTGGAMAEIVKSYPHIKGINFDLPHVISTAPNYEGVSHIGGDMFQEIPTADAVFMKLVMHNWNDEDCIKILKNCRKAIRKKTGKVIIVDIVLDPEGTREFDDTKIILDLAMIAYTSGGKERTELEWHKLLIEAGFPCNKIIQIPAMFFIIEAYLE